MNNKGTSSPCADAEKALQAATKLRFASDEKLRNASDAAKEWSKKAKDFAGTDMWCSADRADALKAEKEVESAVADWHKKQAEVDKARKALESCRKKHGL